MNSRVSRLQLDNLINSISVLKKALTINTIVVGVRLLSYIYCLMFGQKKEINKSISYHLWMMTLIPYTWFMIYHLVLTLPYLYSKEKDLLKIENVSMEWIRNKKRFVSNIGLVLIVWNTFVLLYKQWALTQNTSFYMEYSEIYLSNIFIWMFVLKKSQYPIVITVFAIIYLNYFNYTYKKDEEFIDNFATSINCWIGTCFIMGGYKREFEENFNGKLALEQSELMLKDILELFPSGIVFYNKTKGTFYRNKLWNEILENIKRSWNYEFMTPKLSDTFASLDNEHEFRRSPRFKEKSESLFCALVHKDNSSQTLDNLIQEVNLMMQNSSEEKANNYDKIIEQYNNSFNEYEVKNKDGKVIKEFSIKVRPINTVLEGQSLMIVFNDISERSRLKESRISEWMKTIMLCSISHELRSPVNQINGVLSLLQPTLKSVEQKQLLKIANCSTEMLRIKINDMLDYYEIETNGFRPDIQAFNPREQLKFLESLFSSLIDKKNVKMYFFIHENTPNYIYHDSKRIMQILVNLLSNAIKYTKKGTILVLFDWKQTRLFEGLPEGVIKFTISDSGWGIPKEKRRNLFKFLDFSQFKDSFNMNKGIDTDSTRLAGTGLGISQKIAKQLKTKIQFRSIVGTGSKFHFKLHTSCVKRSPIFSQFSEDKFIKRNRILKYIDKGELSSTVTRINKVQKCFMTYTVKKRSYSNDWRVGKYETVDIKSFTNNFSLIDIDKLNNDVQVDPSEIKDNMSDFQNDNYYLRKFARVSQFENSSDDQNIGYEIADESVDEMKIPLFVDNASNNKMRIRKSICMNSTAAYFSNTETELLSFGKNLTNGKPSHFNIAKVLKGNEILVDNKLSSNKMNFMINIDEDKRQEMDSSVEVNVSMKDHPNQINQSFVKNCGCPSILIVDDQYINRFIIQQFWDKYGIISVQAEDGQEAVDIVRDEASKVCWDGILLVLMDLNMPIMGGIEAAYKIKKMRANHEVNRNIKIVAVTAFPSESEKQKCYKSGMKEFYIKPFTISNFKKLISSE